MKKSNEKILFLLLGFWVLGSSAGLWAQQTEVGLKMDVDKHELSVGDSLNLTLEFRQVGTGGGVVQGPNIPTPDHFGIGLTSSFTRVEIVNNQTAQTNSTRLVLEATKPGEETIGPAVLIYQDPQGKKREIKSNVVTVKISEKKPFSLFGGHKDNPASGPTVVPTPLPNPQDLIGLKPLLGEALHSLLRVLFWIFVFLLVVGYLIRRWLKTKGKAPAVAAPPQGKAAQLRETWKKLGNEDLDAKAFCLGLSGLIRECLQYRFGFEATHWTTEEILEALGREKASADEKNSAEKCLRACDRVLHADGNLTGRDNLRTLAGTLLPKVAKS